MDPYRLPDTVVPGRYELTLRPDLDAAVFTGEVRIHVRLRRGVEEIWLNAAELDIFRADCHVDGQKLATRIHLDGETERCCLRPERAVGPGDAILHLCFRGTLNDQLRGFYRCRYRSADGASRWLAATQFEATDARRAFPCWDEPAFKAVFSTTLVIPAHLQAISNSRLLSEQREGDHRTLRFADTMKMSTYLVAFLVGEWEGGEPTHVGPTPLQVWSVPGKRHLTGFARDIAALSLRYFEDYYDLPYPADKLDLIAVPDFSAGAMENLGAITFRETALLLDESRATHAEKERVADVVAHENAHMWFGDLVTMRWWNGLWLNEAFATFMEMLAVDAWKPAWQRWATFASSRAAALVIDGLRSSRPIEFPVRAPRDADAMFDVLTYDKGAAVLRMLEQFLSPDVFRAGVRLYLRRHAHDNTDTADLWHALAEAAHLDIPSIMDEWIFQAGYPLVQVRREGSDLVLRQQAFSYLRATEPDSRRLWKIPVRVRVDNPTSTEFHRVLLRNEEARMPLPSGAKAVLVNEGSHGFYRVRYDNSLLDALLDRLPSLDASERFTLVNDLWAGVLAGMIPLTEFLERTRLFHGERDRLVWSALLNSQGLLLRLVDDGDRPALRSRIRALLRGAVADLGWQSRDGEDELRQQLRGDLLRAMGILGDDPAVQREAALVYTGGQAEANVHSAAVAILAHAGDAARYEEFQDRFRQSGTPQEEQRYLLALAGFRPAALVERTLQACRDGTIRNQDAPLVLRTMLQQVHSREATWQFLRHHGEDLAQRFPGPGMRRLCEGMTGLISRAWLAEVRAFLQGPAVRLGGKVAEQILEQLEVSVELQSREQAALKDYLRKP